METAGIISFVIGFGIFFLALIVLEIVATWKIFYKAGYEGWECLIPIYNAIVFLRIIGKPWWWLLLFCIPGVNIIFLIWATNMLSKSFGKDEGFTVGLILLRFIFTPILGFGSAQYQGPYGDPVLYRAYREESKGGFDFENNRMA